MNEKTSNKIQVVMGDSIFDLEVENSVLRKEIANVDDNYIQTH